MVLSDAKDAVLGEWSATLTLPDYGRLARHPGVNNGLASHPPTPPKQDDFYLTLTMTLPFARPCST